jgi:alkyldihydroxyacetonephosphate synthase
VDADVSPADTDEVAALVRWANETRTPLYPVGGASNTVDASAPERPGGVAVELSRLDSLTWDEEALLVHAGAGLNLGVVEERLNAHEYTLGHYPQSLHLLTVGGAVATNAIGLLSGRYGRQSDLTLALTAVLPNGDVMRTSAPPLGSAAFDLHRLFIGTEGAFGIITEATLAMRAVPEVRAWVAFTFARWEDAADALRLIHRSDSRPACARLLDTDAAADVAQRHHLPPGHPLLLLAFEGDELAQTGQYQLAYAVCQQIGGAAHPSEVGEAWFEARRASSGVWSANARPGGVADVLALSAPWSSLKALYGAVGDALRPFAVRLTGEVAHAGPHGAALEFSGEAQAEPSTPEAARALHSRLLEAGLTACRAHGGAVAHHYGVGASERRRFLAEERGEAGIAALRAMKTALDPNNILNPGKLL